MTMQQMFPAPAGMSPVPVKYLHHGANVPRTCGDEPSPTVTGS